MRSSSTRPSSIAAAARPAPPIGSLAADYFHDYAEALETLGLRE
jgi:hypothetical protein